MPDPMASEPAEPTTRQDREWLAGMIAAFLSGARGVGVLHMKPWPEVAERLVAWLDDRQLLADPAQTTELPAPWPIAAVGEEPLEPLVSTATTARRRVVQVVAPPSELEEAQQSARFWREQAEGWEHAHQNTVLPYTTELESVRDEQQSRLDRIRAIAEEVLEPRGVLRRRLLAVLNGDENIPECGQ